MGAGPDRLTRVEQALRGEITARKALETALAAEIKATAAQGQEVLALRKQVAALEAAQRALGAKLDVLEAELRRHQAKFVVVEAELGRVSAELEQRRASDRARSSKRRQASKTGQVVDTSRDAGKARQSQESRDASRDFGGTPVVVVSSVVSEEAVSEEARARGVPGLFPPSDPEMRLARVESHDEAFEAFWRAYPRRTAKVDARKAWLKLRPTPALVAVILKAVEAQKGWRQWIEGIYPHPATWLNKHRWEDEQEPPAVPRRLAANLAAGQEWLRQSEAMEAGQ